MEVENTPVEGTPEVQEEVTEEQIEEVTEEQADSPEAAPEEAPAEETEKLILGKYKSQEDLEKAYLEAQRELTKTKQAQSDPQYVYELAKKAGLTDEQAQAEADRVDPRMIDQFVSQKVQAELAVAKDYEKALTILPELGKDATIEAWGRALVDGGMTHEQAAKTIKDKLALAQENARVEGAKSKEAEISEKEAAQTAPTIGNVDSDYQELEGLKAKAKSLNRVEQEDALAELLLKQM